MLEQLTHDPQQNNGEFRGTTMIRATRNIDEKVPEFQQHHCHQDVDQVLISALLLQMEMDLLDEDVRLWSSGKEANIRLLLSTLHHVRYLTRYSYHQF